MATSPKLQLSSTTRPQNGYVARKALVDVKYSTFGLKILKILYLNGFINGYYVSHIGTIRVKLKYFRDDYLFKGLNLISKPGKRIYGSVDLIKSKYYYYNFVIVSTHYGLMTHKEAILKDCGGELLFSLSYC